MKIFNLIIFCLLLNSFSASAEKYAIIIAIGDYPFLGGWPDISSENDIIHVTESLQVLGFSKENITLLQDEKATKKSIITSLDSLSSKLKKGDVIFIHFSGHGQQVLDDNGDEVDNLDEAIVPYDSPLNFEEGVYEGENLIRDDLIGSLTTKMREKCGTDGQVILVLDSCHSGSGTRGATKAKARGTDKIMAPADYKSRGQSKESSMGIIVEDNPNFSPMASFFGASSRELNYETLDDQDRPVGSLSYSFYSILTNMKTSYSFAELYERVQVKMKAVAPRQNPQWEGPSDVLILGGKDGDREILFGIDKILKENQIKINAGTLTEVFTGTTIEVYSLNNEKVLSTGTVTSSTLNTAIVQLDAELIMDDDDLVKIKIKEKTLPPIQCTLSNSISPDSDWNPIVEGIIHEPIIREVAENAELYISECEEDSSLQLMTNDGTILYEKKLDASTRNLTEIELKKVVAAFTQGKFIRSFDIEDQSMKFKLTLLEVDPNDASKEIKSYEPGMNIDIKVGTHVKFKVENVGKKAAYFSLLDIQPDNLINLVIPATSLGYAAHEYYLKPGETFLTNYVIEIYEPYGEETLKLISSKDPMDLSGIIANNGQATRGSGELNQFEQIFSSSFTGSATRGAKVKATGTPNLSTTTLFFTITKE